MVRWTTRVGTNPVEWIKLHDRDARAFERVAQDMVNEMVRRQAAEESIKGYLHALKAWMDWNRIELKRRLIIGRTPKRPVASQQRIPGRAALRRVLDGASTQTRCIMALRCFAGLRPGILGTEDGDDGLVLGDVEGLELRDGQPVVDQDHVIIRVKADLSKNGKPFFTLMGQEGIDYLLAYLRDRITKGEVLSLESPLIAPGIRFAWCNRFLLRCTISSHIRTAMRSAGIQGTTYIWRSYFKTQLLPAQGKKGLVPEYVEFWMGHINGIQSTYSFDKELPPEVMQDIVEQYRLIATEYLETRHGEERGNEALHVATALLRSVGLTDDDLHGLDLEDVDDENLQALVQQRLAGGGQGAPATPVAAEGSPAAPSALASPAEAPRPPQQALVRIEEVGHYLESGWYWRTEAPAPAGQALVEAPPEHQNLPSNPPQYHQPAPLHDVRHLLCNVDLVQRFKDQGLCPRAERFHCPLGRP